MTIAYIAHPIGGDQIGNMEKVADILRYLNLKYEYLVPFAPYMADLCAMNDELPGERKRGLNNCRYLLEKLHIDQLWVCGKVSAGVQMEIDIAISRGIPVKHHPDLHAEAAAWLEKYDGWPENSMFP
jgi:hypothetical protein